MKTKNRFKKIVDRCLYILILLLSIVGCQSRDDLKLNWFDMRVDAYKDEVGAESTLSFDFYYVEDHDPTSYLGTINLRDDGEGWYVDEYVDIPETYRDHVTHQLFTQNDISEQMVRFAANIKFILNGADFDASWYDDPPQEFGPHTNYRDVILEMSK